MSVNASKYRVHTQQPLVKPIYVVDIIRDVVTAMTPKVLPIIQANDYAVNNGSSNIVTLNYAYGHPKELIGTLFQLDQSTQDKMTKYPLIYLVMDFPEDKGQGAGIYAKATLNIILLFQTDPTYKMADRMEKVFKPILFPIYYSLLSELCRHKLINEADPQLLKHRMFIRGFWGQEAIGGTDKTSLNDYVDAVDITNLQLTILYNQC